MKRAAAEGGNTNNTNNTNNTGISDDLFQVIKHGLFNDDVDKDSKAHLARILSTHLAAGYRSDDVQFNPQEDLQSIVDDSYCKEGVLVWKSPDAAYGLKALQYFISKKILVDIKEINIYLQTETLKLNQLSTILSTGGLQHTSLTICNGVLDSAPPPSRGKLKANFGAHLTELNLSKVCFSSNAVTFLTSYFQTSSTLTALRIESEIISGEDVYISDVANEKLLATNIASMLASNTTLKELEFFNFTSIENWPVTLAQSLKVNSTLQTLEIALSHSAHSPSIILKATILDQLLGSLSINKGLTSLDLSGSLPVGYDLKQFSKALTTNTTLTSFTATKGCLDELCVASIKHILRRNSTLKRLNLIDNPDLVEEDRKDRLKLALINSTSLTALYVDKEMFINEDTDLYVQHFICNRSIRILYMPEADGDMLWQLSGARTANLNALQAKFLKAVETEKYDFTDIDRKRLFYFERALMSEFTDENAKAMLYQYNHHNNPPFFGEADVAKYQDYVKNHYQSIKDAGFRDIL